MKETNSDPGAPERSLDNGYPRNVRGNAGFSETLARHDEEQGMETNSNHARDNEVDPGSIGNQNRGDDDDHNSRDDLGVPVLGSASSFPLQNDEPRERSQSHSSLQELDQGDQMQRMAEDGPVWDDELAVANSSDEDALNPAGMPRGSTPRGDS